MNRLYGQQVYVEPIKPALDNIFVEHAVKPVEGLGPFIKQKFVYGFTLYGTKNATDDFLNQIAETIKCMFSHNESKDRLEQSKILNKIYQHGTFVPVLLDKEIDELEDPETLIPTSFMRKIQESNSIADVLRVDGSNLAIEVIEHLLHFITIVGFGNSNPKAWDYINESQMLKAMDEAIEAGVFDISGFLNETDDLEAENLMIRKEFGYWLITSAWNVQEKFGGPCEEWKISTLEEMKELLPLSYDLYINTVADVIQDPSHKDLGKYI